MALAVAAAAACGCQSTATPKPEKLVSTLRLHVGARRDGAKASLPVPVYRQNPVIINVEKEPFLTEGNVAEAKVIDVVGGFALRIRFDGAGTSLLEQCTAANRGRKIAVFSQFGKEIKDARWLAGPIITRRINDGVFTFTPDSTREEAEEIALGLNNVAKKVQW